MRLAQLTTPEGPVIAGVDGPDDAPRFISLNWVDLTLPHLLDAVLADPRGLDRCRDAFARGREDGRYVEGTLLAPLPKPGKVLCIGLNYRDHATESGMDVPSEPICFSKFSSAVTGPDMPIRLPRAAKQVDFEAELVIIIGKSGFEIPAAQALDHVAGYCNGNDVSARDWQIGRPGKQWLLGKTSDTFAPIGPWLVTRDEIGDAGQLDISLQLNGRTMQQGNTSQFIFGVREIIAHASQMMTLTPGDIIFTGTPAGVGMGRTPPVWLKPGDEVEVSIQGLGALRNHVVSATPPGPADR